jgi:hypothetical protein
MPLAHRTFLISSFSYYLNFFEFLWLAFLAWSCCLFRSWTLLFAKYLRFNAIPFSNQFISLTFESYLVFSLLCSSSALFSHYTVSVRFSLVVYCLMKGIWTCAYRSLFLETVVKENHCCHSKTLSCLI